jgi:hypothetical protein
MTDDATTGPLHLTIDADVRIADARRLGGRSEEQLAEVLAGLIRRHAREAGLELVDPQAVRVVVTRAS